MKKLIAFVLVLVMCLTIIACGKQEDATVTNPQITDSQLKEALSQITDAHYACDRLSSHLINNWTTYSHFLYHFDEGQFKKSDLYNSSLDDEYIKSHNLRREISGALDSAKVLLNKSGEGAFYEAVKEYYLLVKSYESLVSKFPAGYSEITYSNAISDMRSQCEKASNEASFYN